MKIISYNVNGIRAAMSKGLTEWLKTENPDIVCFQEIKAMEVQIDSAAFHNLGYQTFWRPAEKKGYSGVAILSKAKPAKVEKHIGISDYDFEGRFISAEFENFTLINSYFPSGTTGEERQSFKMSYLYDFLEHVKKINKTHKNLVISGDYNICHKAIDINHPELHKDVSGFLPEEREWFDKIIDAGFIDSFRLFCKEPNMYSWWSYRAGARPKNLGWRIDYNLVSKSLEKNIKSASILKDIVHSDHCPVKVELEF